MSTTTPLPPGSRPAPIAVPDSVLDDLNARLRNTRWPAALPYDGWTAGADLSFVKDLCAYWAEGYDCALLRVPPRRRWHRLRTE